MQYNGHYLGICVGNDDPEKRGRVQVYVPHISTATYESWAKIKGIKGFKFPGSNINSSLDLDAMEYLRKIIPWAECAMPLVGENASGRYKASSGTASISDSNSTDTIKPTTVESKYQLNKDGIGESPGRKYELQKLRVADAFTGDLGGDDTGGSVADKPRRANTFGFDYTPSTYSNSSKGSFSIPSVGAHLWIFFKDGNSQDPVYFAASHGNEDWSSIYNELDYPSGFENDARSDPDMHTEVYRNKYVINQKGGAIEINNTDNRELLKMTHFSGSFKEFNNYTNSEFAAANDQKLVLEDKFLTVRGYDNQFVGRDRETLIKGDNYRKVGKLDLETHTAWYDTAMELARIKQLFEIKRAVNFHADQDAIKSPVWYRLNSYLQEQEGTAEPCPVCNNAAYNDYNWKLNNTFTSIGTTTTDSSGNGASSFSTTSITTSAASYVQDVVGGTIYGLDCPVCGGTGVSPSSMRGDWVKEPLKDSTAFDDFVKQVNTKLLEHEAKLGRGGNEVINIAKHKIETIGMVMNDFPSVRIDPVGKLYRDSVVIHPDGTFNSQAPSPLVENVHVDDLPGGSYTLNICNRWNVQVGAGGISMKTLGVYDIGGTVTNIGGHQVNIGSDGEVNIQGKRVAIAAEILTLRQKNRKQLLLDSNVGVSQNVVIGGGMYVEGETYLQHVTAPCEIQETEMVLLKGKILKGNLIGYTSDRKAVTTGTSPGGGGTDIEMVVECYPHSHNFKNLPLTLKNTNAGVRTLAGQALSASKRAEPGNIENTPAASKST